MTKQRFRLEDVESQECMAKVSGAFSILNNNYNDHNCSCEPDCDPYFGQRCRPDCDCIKYCSCDPQCSCQDIHNYYDGRNP